VFSATCLEMVVEREILSKTAEILSVIERAPLKARIIVSVMLMVSVVVLNTND